MVLTTWQKSLVICHVISKLGVMSNIEKCKRFKVKRLQSGNLAQFRNSGDKSWVHQQLFVSWVCGLLWHVNGECD